MILRVIDTLDAGESPICLQSDLGSFVQEQGLEARYGYMAMYLEQPHESFKGALYFERNTAEELRDKLTQFLNEVPA